MTTPTSSPRSQSTSREVTARPGRGSRWGRSPRSIPHKPGASFIYRENNRRYIPIKFGVRGRDLASAIAEAQRKVKDPDGRSTAPRLPDRVVRRIRPDGTGQPADAVDRPALDRLDRRAALSGAHSFKDALLVIANVVTATMGGIWALWLTGTPFSISAAVGFISIFGVAVQNGVLLVSYFNQMRAAGFPVRAAVIRGAELRLRPVVMTSLTAILGLLPAAWPPRSARRRRGRWRSWSSAA